MLMCIVLKRAGEMVNCDFFHESYFVLVSKRFAFVSEAGDLVCTDHSCTQC